MQHDRQGNIAEPLYVLFLIGMSLAIWLPAYQAASEAGYGWLAIPLSILQLIVFWGIWIGLCFLIKTAINYWKPKSIDMIDISIYGFIILAFFGVCFAIWDMVIQPIIAYFSA